MTVNQNQQSVNTTPKKKNMFNRVNKRQNSGTFRQQDNKYTTINIYNYFLDDFPKSYLISQYDTVFTLKEKIVQDTKLRMIDIKNFKDERGRFVKDEQILSKTYKNESKLNMEIYFNEDVQITTNNKNVQYFMHDAYTNDFADIYNTIINYHKCEKGGKIVVGVQSNGLIKGINIPEQDSYKENFIRNFNESYINVSNILKDVEISFFRVKGQNKNSYNYHDHKKIMIIKIKGKNQQAKDDSQENSELESDLNSIVYSPINQSTKQQNFFQSNSCIETKQDSQNDIQSFLKTIERLQADKYLNHNGLEQFEILLRQW